MAVKKSEAAAKTSRPSSFVLIDPLDYVIMGELPPQGAMLGYHHLGLTAKVLAKTLGKGTTGAQVSGRLKVMQMLGLVDSVVVLPLGYGLGWQITPEGEKAMNAWRKKNPSTTKGSD